MQDAWPTIGLVRPVSKRAATRLGAATLARTALLWRSRNMSVASAPLGMPTERGAWLAKRLSPVLVGSKAMVYTHPPRSTRCAQGVTGFASGWTSKVPRMRTVRLIVTQDRK